LRIIDFIWSSLGDAGDVEFGGVSPVRRVNDLFVVDVKGVSDQIFEIRACRGDVSTFVIEALALFFGLGGFDGGHFEGWVCVARHRFGWLGNVPCRLLVGADQDER
jgi:hypothetical protein